MRLVNDRVFEILSELGAEDGEFLCECSDVNCIETIQLTLREYGARRAREDRPSLKLPHTPGLRSPKARFYRHPGCVRKA